MRVIVQMASSLVIAFATYSRIPMPRVDWSEENRRYSLCFFPLIGLVIGAVMAGWLWLCDALGNTVLKDYYLCDLIAGYEKEIRTDDPLNITLSHMGDDFTFLISSQGGDKHFAAAGSLKKEDNA